MSTLPASSPPGVRVAAPSLTPEHAVRAAAAAVLTPLLGFWLPMRAFEWGVENLATLGLVGAFFFLTASMLAGSWCAVTLALGVRRPIGRPPIVPGMEAMLAVLLGLVAPNAPIWFGFVPSGGHAQPLLIQALTVFLVLVFLASDLPSRAWVPPIVVGSVRPHRDLVVRAMVAALMPTAILYALLPVVLIAGALSTVDGSGDGSRVILACWSAATFWGVAIGMRAWRNGRSPYLDTPEQGLIAGAGMGLAVAAWFLGGGADAPPALFLFQPAIIFAATVVLGSRREAIDATSTTSTARLDEPLLVPPGRGFVIAERETRYSDPETGREELRLESRWLVPRPVAEVADEYRGRNLLTVRKESDAEVIFTRGGPRPGAVRVVGRPTGSTEPGAPPPGPRTEVIVRVAKPL